MAGSGLNLIIAINGAAPAAAIANVNPAHNPLLLEQHILISILRL